MTNRRPSCSSHGTAPEEIGHYMSLLSNIDDGQGGAAKTLRHQGQRTFRSWTGQGADQLDL